MTLTKEAPEKKTEFFSLNAVSKLKSLAQTPYDLTKEGNLNAERIAKFSAEACGYKMLYATQRIDERVLAALIELAQEADALNKMAAMQNGEIVNAITGYASEERAALHTATRDFFESPKSSKAASEAAKQARLEVDKLKAFMQKIDHAGRFKTMIVVGIGGSELGPKAHYDALQYMLKPGRSVHFLGNIDPDAMGLLLRQINLQETLVLIISKTGTTLETASNEELLQRHFEQSGLKPQEHFVSISCPGSPLDNSKNYLETFHMWEWIGGRYSTTSMVGGVLLSFAFGFDTYWEFLKGANAMDKAALNPDIQSNLPLLEALLGIWNRSFLGYPVLAIIPYSQALARFPAHIQQLDMESNGKHIDKLGNMVTFATGPIIFGEPGTNAQHSFYQLIHQGTTPIPLELIGFIHSQIEQQTVVKDTSSQQKLLANLLAQAIALATGQKDSNPNRDFQGNRPTTLLIGKQLTPFALGALLAFYEHKVAFQGFIWNINSFDQEGVQLGKALASKIIASFASRNNGTSELNAYPIGDAFLKHLDMP